MGKDFISIIKKYNTDNVIEKFSKLSNIIFDKQQVKEIRKYALELPYLYHPIPSITQKGTVLLLAWDIHRIQYASIKFSNDDKHLEISNDQQLSEIVNYFREYENKKSVESLKGNQAFEIYKHLFGMSCEQFLYQDLSWIKQRFNRNYHIMIGSNCINRKIDINSVVNERIGLSADELLLTYLIIFGICKANPKIIDEIEKNYQINGMTLFMKNEIIDVIKYYTISYDEIRKSKVGSLVFYNKPFIKTQKNITMLTNIFLIPMLISDGLYWIVKDYFKDLGKLDFVNDFGIMFEQYFHELVSYYLEARQFQKLPQVNKESADYAIDFETITLLIELKSALINIQVKQQNPDINLLNEYVKRNLDKANSQLQESEISLVSKKPIVKFLVLYENLHNATVAQLFLSDNSIKNRNIHFVTIKDIEIFLELYRTRKEDANKILTNLLAAQSDSSTNLQTELEKLKATECKYIPDYFKSFMDKIENEYRKTPK